MFGEIFYLDDDVIIDAGGYAAIPGVVGPVYNPDDGTVSYTSYHPIAVPDEPQIEDYSPETPEQRQERIWAAIVQASTS